MLAPYYDEQQLQQQSEPRHCKGEAMPEPGLTSGREHDTRVYQDRRAGLWGVCREQLLKSVAAAMRETGSIAREFG